MIEWCSLRERDVTFGVTQKIHHVLGRVGQRPARWAVMLTGMDSTTLLVGALLLVIGLVIGLLLGRSSPKSDGRRAGAEEVKVQRPIRLA